MERATDREAQKTWSYVAAAAANLLVLVAANLHAVWRPWTRGVVTEDWVRVLWIVNMTGVVQIAGNGLLAALRPPRLVRSVELFFSLVALLGAIVFLKVYPFDFSRVAGPWLDRLAHGVLVLGVVAGALAVAINTIRLLAPGAPPPRQAPPHGA